MSDPLDELLAPQGPPASGEVRRRVLDATLKALRRKRGRHEALGLLLAGLAAGVLLLAAPSPQPPERATAPADAAAVEWKALEEDPSLYKEAADRYVEEGAPAEAVRCYGHALDASGDLEEKEGDSFLLAAIKNARRWEKESCDR